MAVAIGDVDTVDHVGVFTPGYTTTVQDSLVRYDRQLAALQAQAVGLARQGRTGTAATVAWLGYEAPQTADVWRPSRSVAGDEAAARGAERLARFYGGLDAARDVPAHVTALDHSYGSLTTGLALQRERARTPSPTSPLSGSTRTSWPVWRACRRRVRLLTPWSGRSGVGHGAYLTGDSTSQYGIAAVVAGVPDWAPRDDGRGFGDRLATPVPWAQ